MSIVTYEPGEFEYGLSRVKSTVIMRNDGEPYFISDGDTEEKVLYGVPLKDIEISPYKSLGVGFEDFSLETIKLGYVNSKKHLSAAYLSRTPARYYKQGLSQNTLRTFVFGVKLVSYCVYKTIMGKYPNKETAFEQVICGELKSCAFCRDFAFQADESLSENTLNLLYRDRNVGTVKYNTEAGVIIHQFNDRFSFLQETLEESWNHV